MKRKFLLPCLALTLTATLAGCSNSASTTSPTPSAPAVAPSESAAPTASPNTVAKGFDRAMDDMGNAVDRMDDMARGGSNSGAGGWDAGVAGSEPQSTTR